jgi:hypothetical protein
MERDDPGRWMMSQHVGDHTYFSDGTVERTVFRPRPSTLVWIAMALVVLCAFLAGLYLGADVEASRPVSPATDAGFVSVVGHEGEILVVGVGGQLRWTTEAELHKAAGHG